MGRKKIEIKKIGCAMKRRTTFHKRSHGILKKAKELAILCDADVAIVMISPAGKVQHFSNRPRTEQLLQQFSKNIQEGNQAGKCSGDKEECKAGCCGEPQLLGEDITSLTSQQNENVQTNYWTSGTNPSSGMQNVHLEEPRQHMQESNESGMSSDCMQQLAMTEKFLLEPEDEDMYSGVQLGEEAWTQFYWNHDWMIHPPTEHGI